MIILPYDKYLKLINVKKENDEITNNNNHSDNLNLPNLEKLKIFLIKKKKIYQSFQLNLVLCHRMDQLIY